MPCALQDDMCLDFGLLLWVILSMSFVEACWESFNHHWSSHSVSWKRIQFCSFPCCLEAACYTEVTAGFRVCNSSFVKSHICIKYMCMHYFVSLSVYLCIFFLFNPSLIHYTCPSELTNCSRRQQVSYSQIKYLSFSYLLFIFFDFHICFYFGEG